MRYPGATWKPLPQNATQSKISPTQVILHSTTGGADIDATWAFFAAGSGGAKTEAHFIVGYDGAVIQAMDTLVRADAQFAGNLHGISIETASNAKASDAWTPEQQVAIVALGKWLLTVHTAILPRECPSALEPGFGFHRLFDAWNQSNHSCPGNLRVKQFPLLLSQIVTVEIPHQPPKPPPVIPMEDEDMLRYVIPGSQQQVLILCGKQVYLNSAAGLAAVPLNTPDASTVANYATVYGPIGGTKNP